MRQVTHALLTRPPLSSEKFHSVASYFTSHIRTPFDLHVLSTPPAFILSQDQTLVKSFDSDFSICRLFDSSQNDVSHFLLFLVHRFKRCPLEIFLKEYFRDGYCLLFSYQCSFKFVCRFLRQLDYFIILSKVCQQLFLNIFLSSSNGEGGIRTHAPVRPNGFQDRLVMTTSIPLQSVA